MPVVPPTKTNSVIRVHRTMAHDYRVSCTEWDGARYFDSLQAAREFVMSSEMDLTITKLD